MNNSFNKPILLIALATGLLFTACKKDRLPCIRGKGQVVTESRMIDGVTEINLGSDATVYITEGSVYSCTVNAQQNIAKNLVFKQSGDRLSIYDKHCIKHYSAITIYITTPKLSSIQLSGSGAVVTTGKFHTSDFEASISGSGNLTVGDSIFAGSLSAKISGSGDMYVIGQFSDATSKISGSGGITLAGSSHSHDLSISGSGKINAFEFYTSSTNIHTSGSGDSRVRVSNTLDVSISGSGDVWYKGFPAITTHISGSGNIISEN